MGPLPCRDGWVCVGVATVPQWEGFCLAIGMPELLADERFQTGGDRFDHADDLDAIVIPRLCEMSAGDLVARLQEHRVPASPALTVLDLLADRQLASRGYWARSARVGRARRPSGARVPRAGSVRAVPRGSPRRPAHRGDSPRGRARAPTRRCRNDREDRHRAEQEEVSPRHSRARVLDRLGRALCRPLPRRSRRRSDQGRAPDRARRRRDGSRRISREGRLGGLALGHTAGSGVSLRDLSGR